MTQTVTKPGTYGGMKYRDTDKVDPDVAEKNEVRRFHPVDEVTSVLNNALGDVGPGIIDPQFVITTPGLRDRDITFDRCFPKYKILVQFFYKRQNADQTQDDVMLKDIADRKAFAAERKYRFLAVIDGNIEREDLARLKAEVKASEHNAR